MRGERTVIASGGDRASRDQEKTVARSRKMNKEITIMTVAQKMLEKDGAETTVAGGLVCKTTSELTGRRPFK